MTSERVRSAWARIVWTTLCMCIVLVAIDAGHGFMDRRVQQAERAAKRAIKEQIERTPTVAWLEYYSVEPVEREITNDIPLTMQSNAIYRRPIKVEHMDRLKCRPISGGPLRQISKVPDTIKRTAPALIGLVDTPKGMENVERFDGEWDYTGALPLYDARCFVFSTPCIQPHPEVEKCLPTMRSGAVVIRAVDKSDDEI